MAADVTIAAGLGRFFGAKFRSGVLYAIYEQSGDRTALESALEKYQQARSFWFELADATRDVYQPDVTVGELDVIRGHWLDRLPAIDADIDLMKKKLEGIQNSAAARPVSVRLAVEEAMGRPKRIAAVCHHIQPSHFRPGEPLDLELSSEKEIASVRLYYRHVNHAERYQTATMQSTGGSFRATIPAVYTNSLYPLQYYFELRDSPRNAWLFPGFTIELTNQPYFVVRRA